MRVLFADSVVGSTITELEARGHTCVVEPKLKAADLAGSVGGYDAMVVRSTKVGRDVFEVADRLARTRSTRAQPQPAGFWSPTCPAGTRPRSRS